MVESGLPREAERILLALDEQTRLTTREVVDEADLATTQSAHHYVSDYLDGERKLVLKHEPEPGKQAEWEITHAGEMWVERLRDDIAIPQTPEEAVEVATKAKEKAASAEGTASTTIAKFEQHKLDIASEFGSLQDDISKIENKVARLDEEVRGDVAELRVDLNELDERVQKIKNGMVDIVDSVEERFETERNITRSSLDKKAQDTDLIRAEFRIEDLEEESENQNDRLDRIERALGRIDQYVDEDLFEDSRD